MDGQSTSASDKEAHWRLDKGLVKAKKNDFIV